MFTKTPPNFEKDTKPTFGGIFLSLTLVLRFSASRSDKFVTALPIVASYKCKGGWGHLAVPMFPLPGNINWFLVNVTNS